MHPCDWANCRQSGRDAPFPGRLRPSWGTPAPVCAPCRASAAPFPSSPPAAVAGKSKHPDQLSQQRPVDSELIKHRSLQSLYDVPESGGRREAWGNLLARATSKLKLERRCRLLRRRGPGMALKQQPLRMWCGWPGISDGCKTDLGVSGGWRGCRLGGPVAF